MEQAKYQAVMDRLEAFAHQVGVECRRETLENGIELISFVSAVREDGTGLVYFQLALVRVLDSVDMAQIYTTLLTGIGPGLARLEQVIPEWNQASILGSYGIRREEDGQLYHRYRLPLDDSESPELIASHISSTVTLVYEEVSRRRGEAADLTTEG